MTNGPKPGQGWRPDPARPVMLLDVDGVLNAMGESPWPDAKSSVVLAHFPWLDHGMRHQIAVTTARSLGAALLALDVEIRWLTTWAHAANRKISPRAGLPGALPVAGQPDRVTIAADAAVHGPTVGRMVWKTRVVTDVLRAGRHVIWVDDEATPDVVALIDSAVTDRLFVVTPDEDPGLTPADIVRIGDHGASLRTPTP